VSPLRTMVNERITTLFSGSKRYVLVPPWESHKIYATEHGTAGANPLDPELDIMPLTAEAHVFDVHLLPGESIYIPSYWFRAEASRGSHSALSMSWNTQSYTTVCVLHAVSSYCDAVVILFQIYRVLILIFIYVCMCVCMCVLCALCVLCPIPAIPSGICSKYRRRHASRTSS
jgi:Cupin-like domain